MTVHLNNAVAPAAKRDTMSAMWRGTRHTCPSCGTGSLYARYLKVRDHCTNCGEALHHHRADDAPPYFTIFIVGHLAVAGVLAMEQAMKPSVWTHIILWMPFVVICSLAMLPRIKGALVGLQWALRMHGFAEDERSAASDTLTPPSNTP